MRGAMPFCRRPGAALAGAVPAIDLQSTVGKASGYIIYKSNSQHQQGNVIDNGDWPPAASMMGGKRGTSTRPYALETCCRGAASGVEGRCRGLGRTLGCWRLQSALRHVRTTELR